MVISYFGEGCFRLQNGDLSLLVDPLNNRLKGDVVLRTLTPSEIVFPKAGGETFEILSPGEYEVKRIEITGLPIKEESTEKFLKTIYRVRWDDIVFAFLGHLSRPPVEDVLEELGEVEVLVLPAAGGQLLQAEEAVKLVKKLEPSVVLLSFVKSTDEIQKALGKKIQQQEKLVFRKKDLEEMKEEFILLKKAN